MPPKMVIKCSDSQPTWNSLLLTSKDTDKEKNNSIYIIFRHSHCIKNKISWWKRKIMVRILFWCANDSLFVIRLFFLFRFANVHGTETLASTLAANVTKCIMFWRAIKLNRNYLFIRNTRFCSCFCFSSSSLGCWM